MGCGASATGRTRERERRASRGPHSGTPAEFERRHAFGELLGKGHFGQVFATFERSTGEQSAVKVIKLEAGHEGPHRALRKAAIELQMWRRVGKHPNIVGLQASFWDREKVYMVMERCEWSVKNMLAASPSVLMKGLPRIFQDMLLGIQACHSALVVHRDVKMSNFLIGKGGSGVKLCDFGIAAQLPRSGGGLTGEYGTPSVMSPEMLQGAPYGCGTDIWSFGSLAYHVMFRELPYVPQSMTATATKDATRAGQPSPRWLLYNKESAAASFLRQLLQRDPATRASADEALRHPFLVGFQQNHSFSIDTQDTLAPNDSDCMIADLCSETLETEDHP